MCALPMVINSFARRSLLVGLALTCSATLRAQQLPPIVLVHGIMSSASTWDGAWAELEWRNGGPLPHYAASTSTFNSISSQKDQVRGYLDYYGISSASPVVGAHSMGGLIARSLLHDIPTDGIVTAGTPHQGHQLIGGDLGLVAVAVAINDAFIEPLSYCTTDENNNEVGPCMGFEVWNWLTYTWMFASAFVVAEYLVFQGHNSITDMHPNSAFIADLNGNVGAELTSDRRNLLAQLEEWEAPYGFFRLFQSQWQAVNTTWQFCYEGFDMRSAGLELVLTDPSDEYWDVKVLGGAALIFTGEGMMNVGAGYSSMIGGWPHDGFVPVASQAYPSASSVPFIGVSHTEETSHFLVAGNIWDLAQSHLR